MGYIYQLRNTLNDMIYIGQTINIKRRMKEYKNKIKYLKKSLKEYLSVYYLFFKESDFVKESVETNM